MASYHLVSAKLVSIDLANNPSYEQSILCDMGNRIIFVAKDRINPRAGGNQFRFGCIIAILVYFLCAQPIRR